jgi:steroid 5-alpha reductase family enzyme
VSQSSILLLGLAAAFGLMTVVWIASLAKRDVSIIDIFWGPGFALIAWLYFALGDPSTARQLILPALVTVWGLRLGLYILWRGRGKGEDYRYAEMRHKWGARFPVLSLAIVFWLQAGLLWLIGLPLMFAQLSAQPSGSAWLDAVGLVLFATGLFFESVGDLQLARFKDDPANKGKVLDSGLWRYTRHPNYFGDATVWWGFWLIALAAGSPAWTVVCPLLMTVLLLKVSGVALLEKGLAKTKPQYRDYVRKTSAFFPWPPRAS